MTSVRSTSRSDARIVVVLVQDDRQVDRLRNRGPQRRQQRAHAVQRLDDVGVRLPVMIRSTEGLPLAEPSLRRSSHRIDHLRDIGRAALRRRPCRRRSAGGIQPRSAPGRSRLDLPVPVAFLDRALGTVGVGVWRCAVRTCLAADAVFVQRVGLSSTRTAGNELPPTVTWPTPCTCDSFCARMVEAASYICPRVERVRRQRDDHDRRIGRVDLAIGRVAAASRWAAGCARH